jgi:predicted house-cleaning noncanonical NTP pyrophosphatase (MazG superfamily)
VGEIVYNKLVRDAIPAIIERDGQVPVVRTLGTSEYRRALLEKLVEEAQELLESDGDIGERADIAEVLKALDPVLGYTDGEIEAARAGKAEKRGGFEQKIFLEKAITDD